ncbi:MAG: hypothetical protein ACXVZZ_09710 [Terriglobales bacterium]
MHLVIFGFNTDVKYADTVYHVQTEARQHELLLQTLVFVKGRCIGKRATSYAEKMKDPAFSEELVHELLKDQHKHFVAAVREGHIEAEIEPHAEPAAEAQAVAAAPAMTATDLAELPVIEDFVVHADTVAEEAHLVPVATPDIAIPIPLEPAPSAPPADVSPPHELAAQFAAAVAGKPQDAGFTLSPAGSQIGKGLSLECLPPTLSGDGSGITIGVKITDEGAPAGEAQVACRITSGKAAATYVYANAGNEGVADVYLALGGLDLTATAVLVQATHRGKSASRKYNLKPTT